LTAFLAVLASMAETTRRRARGPVRRRARRRRRSKTNAARSRRPAAAVRGFGDDAWLYPRRPSDYVAAGMVVGSTAAFAVVALGRAVRARPDGGPDIGLARLRVAARRAVRRRPRSVQADDGDDSADAVAVPVSTSVPVPSVVADAVGRGPRHMSGAG
jgi:hypothetical protein